MITNHPAVAGLVGAVISAGLGPGASWKERFWNVGCGVALALFVASPLTEYLSLNTERFTGAIGFVLGLVGMHVMRALVQWARDGGFLPLFTKNRE